MCKNIRIHLFFISNRSGVYTLTGYRIDDVRRQILQKISVSTQGNRSVVDVEINKLAKYVGDNVNPSSGIFWFDFDSCLSSASILSFSISSSLCLESLFRCYFFDDDNSLQIIR